MYVSFVFCGLATEEIDCYLYENSLSFYYEQYKWNKLTNEKILQRNQTNKFRNFKRISVISANFVYPRPLNLGTDFNVPDTTIKLTMPRWTDVKIAFCRRFHGHRYLAETHKARGNGLSYSDDFKIGLFSEKKIKSR